MIRLTERLRLAPPVPADVQAHFEIHGDPRTNRFNPAGPCASLGESAAAVREWIEHWQRSGYGYWAVSVQAGGPVIGFGGIIQRDYGDGPVLNLYYRFRPEAWGLGYAQEMAAEAIRLAGELELTEPIVAVINEENVPSVRTAERVGLRFDKIIKLPRGERLQYRYVTPTD